MPSDWTYSGDPTNSQLDEVRFMVQDTDPAVPLLTDTEINYLVGKWFPLYGNVTLVASVAAASISRKFAGIVSISADGVSVNVADICKAYADMAGELRQEAERSEPGGEIDISDVMFSEYFDTMVRPLTFRIGMDDYYAALAYDAAGPVLPFPLDWPYA